MTTTLIVLAHPDRRSFNGAWADATAKASSELGHTVEQSDLVAMNFNPVESVRHYAPERDKGVFDPLKGQEEAAKAGMIPEDVADEIEKLRKADRVVFHFPLWWFAPPAILKGWFDRVLLHGELHDVEQRFDRGLFTGKRALFCVTTGSTEGESSFKGKEGDIAMLLWPVAYTLRYLGFSVLLPKIVHGVHGYHEGVEREKLQMRLKSVLDGQKELITGFDQLPLMEFNNDEDFDEKGTLKPDRPSFSSFIRQTP